VVAETCESYWHPRLVAPQRDRETGADNRSAARERKREETEGKS